MIGWVDSMCKDWAGHKLSVHGYPEIVPLPSTLGQRGLCDQYRSRKRIGREPIRAVGTRGTPKRNFKEVWSENALHVARAIGDMPAEKLAVMTVHYLYPEGMPRKVSLVQELNGKQISERTYWRRLHGVHCHIAANLT